MRIIEEKLNPKAYFILTDAPTNTNNKSSEAIHNLEYFKENDTVGSNNTHTFSSLLGETSPNPNPFFTENVGKATIDWSWREVELRDLYKSKTFKIENAIEKLKAKMMEDMKKNKQ